MGEVVASLMQTLGRLPELVSAWSENRALWLVLGLVLLLMIGILIRNTRPSPPPRPPRSTTCLVCYQPLEPPVYVDRYFPNWVVCRRCYEGLSPYKQRQYLAEQPRVRVKESR